MYDQIINTYDERWSRNLGNKFSVVLPDLLQMEKMLELTKEMKQIRSIYCQCSKVSNYVYDIYTDKIDSLYKIWKQCL